MTSKRLAVCAALLTTALLALPGAPPAESAELGFFGWGVRGGLSVEPDQVFGGFHFELGDFAENVLFRPNIEFGVGDDQTVLAINAAVHWLTPRRMPKWQPYIGGELGINHREIDRRSPFRDTDDTDLAVNFVGGLESDRRGGGRMLLEGKVGLAEKPRVKLLIGWTF